MHNKRNIVWIGNFLLSCCFIGQSSYGMQNFMEYNQTRENPYLTSDTLDSKLIAKINELNSDKVQKSEEKPDEDGIEENKDNAENNTNQPLHMLPSHQRSSSTSGSSTESESTRDPKSSCCMAAVICACCCSLCL